MANLCTGSEVDLKSQGITDIFIPPLRLKESSSPLSSVHRSGNIIYKNASSKGITLREVASPRASNNKPTGRVNDLDSMSDATTTREVIERVYANENKLYQDSIPIAKWQEDTAKKSNLYSTEIAGDSRTLQTTGPQRTTGGMLACCGQVMREHETRVSPEDYYMSNSMNVVSVNMPASDNLNRSGSAVRVTAGKASKKSAPPLEPDVVVHDLAESRAESPRSVQEPEWKGPAAIIVQDGVKEEPILVDSTVPPRRMFPCCGGGKFIPVEPIDDSFFEGEVIAK